MFPLWGPSHHHLPSSHACPGRTGLMHGSHPIEMYISLRVERVNEHIHGLKKIPSVTTINIDHKIPLHQAANTTIHSFKSGIYWTIGILALVPRDWSFLCPVIQAWRPLSACLRGLSFQTLQHSCPFYHKIRRRVPYFNSIGEHVLDENMVVLLTSIKEVVCF